MKEISMGNPTEEAELFITKGNMNMMGILEIQELQDMEYIGIINKGISTKDSGRILKCKKESLSLKMIGKVEWWIVY